MKNDEESGFILMIVIMLAIAIFIVGFAVYRITQANEANEANVGIISQNILPTHS